MAGHWPRAYWSAWPNPLLGRIRVVMRRFERVGPGNQTKEPWFAGDGGGLQVIRLVDGVSGLPRGRGQTVVF